MTTALSVSAIKAGRARQPNPEDGKPRSGTIVRQFYDDLRRGEVVTFGRQHRTMWSSLTDFYGMDIESVRSEAGALIGYRLAGEWVGSEYVPIERLIVSLMETD